VEDPEKPPPPRKNEPDPFFTSVQAIRAHADNHARNLDPVIAALADEGITSLGAVAGALNERGMLTPRGGRWHKSSVRNLLDRLATKADSRSAEGS
jgi:hypothetical protein